MNADHIATLRGWADPSEASHRPPRRSADESGLHVVVDVANDPAVRYEVETRSSTYFFSSELECVGAFDKETGERAHLRHLVGQQLSAGAAPIVESSRDARALPWLGARAVLVDAAGRCTYTSRVIRFADHAPC
jgi:hypothetical protein